MRLITTRLVECVAISTMIAGAIATAGDGRLVPLQIGKQNAHTHLDGKIRHAMARGARFNYDLGKFT